MYHHEVFCPFQPKIFFISWDFIILVERQREGKNMELIYWNCRLFCATGYPEHPFPVLSSCVLQLIFCLVNYARFFQKLMFCLSFQSQFLLLSTKSANWHIGLPHEWASQGHIECHHSLNNKGPPWEGGKTFFISVYLVPKTNSWNVTCYRQNVCVLPNSYVEP